MDFSEPIQLNIFIGSLRPQSKQLLDASARGKIKLKTPEEAMELIENMASSDHAILRDQMHIPTKKKACWSSHLRTHYWHKTSCCPSSLRH